MSALLDVAPLIRPMCASDVDAILPIERDIYTHPWTLGNFRDSLQAGYSCWLLECAHCVAGYGVLMIGVQQAHLLNLSVARDWQRRGLGQRLLAHLVTMARNAHAQCLLLEVRPSNVGAHRLYERAGFRELTVRRNYYPAHKGREDAILMRLDL